MKALLFFSIVFLTFLDIQAQDYVAGTIITNNSDSIRGFIKKETDIVLSQKVEIKALETAQESQAFLPSQVKGFVVAGRLYESLEVEENKRKVSYFLKCLVKGQNSLYLLRKSTSDQVYYLKDSLETLYKLEVVVEQVDRYIRTSEKYKGVLNYCFRDCPAVQKQVATTKYADKELIALVEKYNACKSPGSVSKVYSRKLAPHYNVNVGVGAFALSDYTNYAAKAHLEISYPELSKGMSIRVGVNYFSSMRDDKEFKNQLDQRRYYESILSIPVLFNGELSWGRFRPAFYAGFSLIFHNMRTDYYQVNQQVKNKTRVGPGMIFGFGFDYFVTKRLAITGDIRYELYLHPSVGLSYRFKNKL